VEHFEPYRRQTTINEINNSRNTGWDRDEVKSSLKHLIKQIDDTIVFVPSYMICPLDIGGLQKNVNRTNFESKFSTDTCILWNHFYGIMRIKFPNKSGQELIRSALVAIRNRGGDYKEFLKTRSAFIRKYIIDIFRLNNLDTTWKEFKKDYIEFVHNRTRNKQYEGNNKERFEEFKKREKIINNYIENDFKRMKS
jgi:hypothetical protein